MGTFFIGLLTQLKQSKFKTFLVILAFLILLFIGLGSWVSQFHLKNLIKSNNYELATKAFNDLAQNLSFVKNYYKAKSAVFVIFAPENDYFRLHILDWSGDKGDLNPQALYGEIPTTFMRLKKLSGKTQLEHFTQEFPDQYWSYNSKIQQIFTCKTITYIAYPVFLRNTDILIGAYILSLPYYLKINGTTNKDRAHKLFQTLRKYSAQLSSQLTSYIDVWKYAKEKQTLA